MSSDKSIWTAVFIGYETLKENSNYRRLNLIDVRNRNGDVVKKEFFIDESEELQIDNITNNKIICFFTSDEKLENVIKFCPYPPPKKEGTCTEVQQKEKGGEDGGRK